MKVRGFILVELLVTISIIGLLIAAAAFSLSNSRSNARDAVRFADSITIGKAIDSYVAANRESFPPSSAVSCTDSLQSALRSSLPNASVAPKDPRPLQEASSTIDYRKCYTLYRNTVGGTTFADITSYQYLIEIGTEKDIPADISTHRRSSDFSPTITPVSSGGQRTPFYYPGPFCGTSCP
jgi:type II secretory pathway pseudopilin PulG